MVKTTIDVDDELWKKFSILVIKEKGYRKKNDIIQELISQYIKEKQGVEKHDK